MTPIVRRGFTLVELLFTVAFIAVMAMALTVSIHFLAKWW